MKNIIKRILAVFSALVLIFIVLAAFSAQLSYTFLAVTRLAVGESPDVRAAVISDLHGNSFGEYNAELISRIEREKPDIIFILGDMMNSDGDAGELFDLCFKLSDIAPTYYALGNHELEYMKAAQADLVSLIESSGVAVLEREYADIDVNGTALRVGGMFDYAFAAGTTESTSAENMDPAVFGFLSDFENTDRYKIMLCHRPDSFIFGDAAQTWDVDLVLSGHTHGGQVRLPVLGGAFAPDQGRFPSYDAGLFEKGKVWLFITRGLGSQPSTVPRINNLPEIAVLSLGAEGREP